MQLTLDMPVYAWAIVAVVALAWLKVILPEHLFRLHWSKPAPSRYLELNLGPAQPAAKSPTPVQAPAAKWTLDLIRQLDGARLGRLVCGFWEARACKVEVAAADVIVYRPATGRAFAVARCQAFGANPTDLAPVRSLWDVVQQRQAPLGLLYGVSGFTPEALAFAKDKPLKLLMGSDLLTEIGHLRPDTQRTLLASVTQPEQRALAA